VVEGARLAIEEKRFEAYRQQVLIDYGSDKGF
jgi:hypothetical protein